MEFREEKGIGCCGMACALCNYEGLEDCPGCTAKYNSKADDPRIVECTGKKNIKGCFACSDYPCGGENDDCFVRQCARSKKIDGCFACPDYPCFKEWGPFKSRRNKAFLRYAREFGKQALIDRLRANHENGIIYHKPGTRQHQGDGDYDALATELEIYNLLRYGRRQAASAGRYAGVGVEIAIKPLSPELMADYFDFFNNRAFTDNPPWGGCYCTNPQMTKEESQAEIERVEKCGGGQEGFMRALCDVVIRQITSGKLRGYLAYADGLSIGWCNANDRAGFPTESLFGPHLYAPAEKREKAVICFEIAPEYRGKGVASALLNRVVCDAEAEGYAAVVGFPHGHEERNEWDFKGPVRLYEKNGFIKTAMPDGSTVMRKELKRVTVR